MSNLLKSALTAGVGTGGVSVYTVPASTTATVIGCSIANNSSTTVITVQVTVTRGGTTVNWVPPGAQIPVGGSLQCVGVEGKIVLMAGDYIRVITNTSTADVIVSMLEQS